MAELLNKEIYPILSKAVGLSHDELIDYKEALTPLELEQAQKETDRLITIITKISENFSNDISRIRLDKNTEEVSKIYEPVIEHKKVKQIKINRPKPLEFQSIEDTEGFI